MEKLRNKLCIWLLNISVKLAKVTHKAGIKTDGCFRTFTRKKFNILNPTSDMIDIVDIAKGLAYKPHFSGFSPKFFSIAEHSLLVEEYTRSYHGESCYKLRLEALLHDASEAYTGDMIKPIKNLLPNFVLIEKKIQKAIYRKYGIDPHKNGQEVKFFDNKVQDIEAGVFYDTMDIGRKKHYEDHFVKYLTTDDAYKAFIDKFNYLTSKIQEQ
ncbi:hypothetical protein D0T53_11110 [Dysgonomonas sp. 216]|uniref:hypothetical protein n=1 Tax=Dysgonomonas sp. 216 TaxID=2302934 RepID=UPI0013D1751C|nr:hypothetical protein [Dysgonomonas sp. 216]NDW19453.1 hypothetical protein [Dysgonomonas sp. 216]